MKETFEDIVSNIKKDQLRLQKEREELMKKPHCGSGMALSSLYVAEKVLDELEKHYEYDGSPIIRHLETIKIENYKYL